jgi:TRAP-type uncharacterized transport system fused permease subunit
VLTRTLHKRFAVVWILFVIVLSLQPARVADTLGRNLHHQILHVALFGVTALVLLPLSRSRREQFNAIASVVCLATAIEISQYLIYHLPWFEWWDIREDAIGAVIALLIHQFWPIPVL